MFDSLVEFEHIQRIWSLGSVVGIAKNYGLDGPAFESIHKQKVFPSPKPSRPALVLSRAQSAPREADHSTPSNEEFEYLCFPYSLYVHDVHRDHFTFSTFFYLTQ